MDVEAIRREIPATQRMIYVNSGWSGPSPLRVVERIRERLMEESNEGPTTRGVYERGNRIRGEAIEEMARLVGALPEELLITQNTTEGINIVLNGLPWRKGDEIVTDDLEHTSGLIPSYSIGQRLGVKVRLAELEGADTAGSILERFGRVISRKTKLIVVSHIMYTTGLLLPLKELSALARSMGVQVLVDGAQSVGQLPVDVKELGCDFYAFPAHKWLLGPGGVGGLYIRHDLIPIVQPIFLSGRAVSSYDFSGGFQPQAEEITKFQLTTSSTALLAGALEAARFYQERGPQEVWERGLYLRGLLIEELQKIPAVHILSPRNSGLASGLFTFSLDGWEPKNLNDALWEQGNIVCRWVNHPPGVRLSLAYFNTEEELKKVTNTILRLAADRAK